MLESLCVKVQSTEQKYKPRLKQNFSGLLTGVQEWKGHGVCEHCRAGAFTRGNLVKTVSYCMFPDGVSRVKSDMQ